MTYFFSSGTFYFSKIYLHPKLLTAGGRIAMLFGVKAVRMV